MLTRRMLIRAFEVSHVGMIAAAPEEFGKACELTWQGDFGKGVKTGSGIWSDPGANPCTLIFAPVAGVSTQGIPEPQFRLGMVVTGDYETEFVYAKLTLAGVTDLLPGDMYFMDGAYNLTLFSTTKANNTIGAKAVCAQVYAPATAAGTYYLWVARAGQILVRAIAGSVANGAGETDATTAGTIKAPASATAGQKSAGPFQAIVASSGLTFTGNTTNGSPYITSVASVSAGGGITDLCPGMTITGTNLPANSCIAAIDRLGAQWRIAIGTSTTGLQNTLQNATGTASGTTFTVTTHISAVLYWPTLNKQN
jgi:hypothetical protein